MKDTTKQVLILNNFSLPEIQQAIIILRHPNPENETRIIIEAEKVIENYFRKKQKKDERPTNAVLLAAVLFGAAVTALAVYGGIHLVSTLMG